ncbi:MAG: PAS domain S-box protein, partial [Anaerolineales bacterium]|nr:PAS domain S-box protein [Anaerolineales bacterium]
LGRTLTDLLPPAVAEDFLATGREVERAGGPLSFERRLPVGGQLRCFQIINYPVYNAAGEFEGVAGIALDITERQAAEAALREREAQFRLISELTSDYTFSFRAAPDGALRLEWSLGAVERISGYSLAELEAAEDWLVLVHPADRPALQDFLRARLAEGTPGSQEFRLVARSGASRQILGYFRPLPDETGRVGRLLGSGQDITERRQAEQALRLTQFTVDRAADAIFWIRADGRLRAANEAAGRLLGYSHGELLARSVLDLAAELSAAAWSAQWEILRQRGALQYETILRTRDGRLFPAEVSASFLEFGGQTLACAFARDITERRRAAAELERLNADLEERVRERTARLEAATQEMETFSYSVSHDLRAPLRAINGFAAILAERHAAGLNAEGRRYLDNIVTAGGRMSQLIDDLLAYSRVGRRAVRRGPVPLRPLLEEVGQELAARAAEARAEVSLPAELPLVQADPGLLRQIFGNLLENALLYHRPGVPPRIAITVQWAAAGQVVIAVADNGLGIRPEYQERIFDVFQRLHGDDQYPGTGLGLALVRKAAGLLNGMVWVESTEGQGSTFFVRLPTEAA